MTSVHDKKRSILALLALAASAFAIGTTEFISVGLLPLIADDMNISVTTAGLTVSLYALGVTVGAPVLTSVTSSMPRKALLLVIMIIFMIGNGLAACAGSIGVLLTARVISAFSHGVFMSIGSTIAASLVPADKRAGAISIMFTGLTIAMITGVPIGTFLGQQFGWRIAFAAIVAVGALAFIANSFLVPADLPKGVRTSFKSQLKLVTNGRLLLLFIITALGYGGTFVVFTYLSPLLQHVTGFKQEAVAVILLAYGIAVALGNIIGGKAANQKPLTALFYMFIAQAAVLLILTAAAPYQAAGFIVIMLRIFSIHECPRAPVLCGDSG